MKPGTLVPLNGKWQSPKAMLHHIASDDDIVEFVVIAVRKDGTVAKGQF